MYQPLKKGITCKKEEALSLLNEKSFRTLHVPKVNPQTPLGFEIYLFIATQFNQLQNKFEILVRGEKLNVILTIRQMVLAKGQEINRS